MSEPHWAARTLLNPALAGDGRVEARPLCGGDGTLEAAGDEPTDGSHVAVWLDRWRVHVYRRDDAEARTEGLPHTPWMMCSPVDDQTDGSSCSWEQLKNLGRIAHVGAFVDRTVQEMP